MKPRNMLNQRIGAPQIVIPLCKGKLVEGEVELGWNKSEDNAYTSSRIRPLGVSRFHG